MLNKDKGKLMEKTEAVKESKVLHIKVHKPIPDIMDEYCKATGLSPKDIGFHSGFILSARDDLATPLLTLNQLYFFAGVYYAEKYRGKFEFKRVPKKTAAEANEFMKKALKEDNLTYVG
jgi:hypothetical protein